MSYLTFVCGRFHGEFANPRGASLRPGAFGAIQQSCSASPADREKGKNGRVPPGKNPLFSLSSNLFRRFVLLACDSIRRLAKPSLSDLATPIRQVIQIEMLGKLSSRSSISLSLYVVRWINSLRKKSRGSLTELYSYDFRSTNIC